MWQLISILIVITIIYMIQHKYPVVAAFIAIVPIKIIATSLFAYDRGVLKESVGTMLIGQFMVGFILLILYINLR